MTFEDNSFLIFAYGQGRKQTNNKQKLTSITTMSSPNFQLEPVTWQKMVICVIGEIITMNSFIKEL